MCIQVMAESSVYSDYIVQHYTEDEGLPNNIVNSSLKTKDGFLWFGTWYGLCRFDGSHFQHFSNTYSFTSDQPPRKVETMVEDGNGNIWIKTIDWKVSLFVKQEERFEDIFDELKSYSRNLQIIKIQSDGHGHVLMLTKDKNLLVGYSTAEGKILIRQIASSKGHVNNFNYQLNSSFVDIKNGFASYVGDDYKIYAIPVAAKKQYNKEYWNNYFQNKAKTEDILYARFPNKLFTNITDRNICKTKNHGTFYLTQSGEVFREFKGVIEPLKSLSDKPLKYLSMTYDQVNDMLWLTTSNDGIYSIVFPLHQFSLYTLPFSESNGVRSLFQMENGDVWVGDRNKNLYILDGNTGRVKNTLSYSQYHIGSVYFIMKDSRGRIWLSTKGDGVTVAIADKSQPSGYRFSHYKHDAKEKSSLSGNNVYVTYEDSYHRIWIGTLDCGLNLVHEQNNTISFLNKYNGMKGYPGYGLYMEVRNMVEDKNHRMLVGTIDGLMSFDTHFKHLKDLKIETYRQTEANTLANADIYALYKDQKQNVWVCTFGGGLARIDGFDAEKRYPIFQPVGRKEGLQNDVIISILEDRHGQLWLGNSRGLSVFNRSTDRIRNFDKTDGFPNISMEETSSLLNKNGDIWLGAKEGILVFNPSRLSSHHVKYPVYIVGCTINNQDIRIMNNDSVFGKSITYTKYLELNHNQNMFTLEFAALNYASKKHISYRYKLEGFDNDWHYSGTNRIASYTNVSPGTYTFIVEAMDASSPGTQHICKLEIRILPPWWATWWAYTLYAILLITLLYFTARYARYQLRLKNDLYIQTKISEFKRQYGMEQEDAGFLNQIKEIIDKNLDNQDFDIGTIAQTMGMSRSAFFKRLKSITGQSPSEMVKDHKLSHAMDMLKNTDLSISAVAYQSGFSDVGYFGKCFRKKYGMSARDFKKQS